MKWYLKVLSNYANFSGRASRSEYWYFFLFNFIICMILAVVDKALGLTFGLYSIYWIATIVPGIAVSVRRMHDVDKSGWFILIPIYNLILTCTAGTPGPNQYGADPFGEGTFEFETVHHTSPNP